MRNGKASSGNSMLAAERRSRIYEYAAQKGSVSVSELAEALGVVENTIRRDLDQLHEEGKLLRSHGGATIKQRGMPVPHYSQTRGTHMEEKSWIGQAALKHVPESGLIFINSGSTTYALAAMMPEGRRIKVITISLEIAAFLAPHSDYEAHIIGGKINPDSLSSTCPTASAILDKLYWDVSFLGVEAIDVAHGITSSYLECDVDATVVEHSRKTVVLCDSSKFGRVSNVMVAPISAIDVIISDKGLDPQIADEFRARGVEVELAG